ncbi:2-oxo-4-hydroxy-4-carboxy-5-ureidoimidazoline decarboxylase [Nocardioides sp. BP30]|uniref:2-oxo-4-hydroxy-4-carboxy-5-ureidoimidazoline decarboxylase n=1 Tax=Nocardioides sp. BP30 TaxID=3036374 RepID=UPI0024684ED9|nr:2-oxo-4-hydroxy-4-carboxy-5-ureidoimidazoline decarboxylase [Nocardioides sp. BP30]WGL52629.1 2-oxo-4-hydroxy-4-carboxy-5-ureidoimidazoline decarboxylase [Nocardioides sp. BP30]
MELAEFNAMAATQASALVRACAGIESFVAAIVGARPYADVDTLLATARVQAAGWTPAEVDAALADHPRIGERPAGSTATAALSRGEQAGLSDADDELRRRLAEGNRRYESRFDRIYLVRAAGRSGEELLALLEDRLGNDEATEREVVREQLAEIALLRLAGLVEQDAPMTSISTHVLDAARGLPAAGLPGTLQLPDGTTRDVVTDDDGRARIEGEVPAGTHRLSFATGGWFAAQQRATFYPRVEIAFDVTAGEHHHVALLLSPFAYTTYRGS